MEIYRCPMLEIEGESKMAVDRAKEARKKAKASREASLKKSKKGSKKAFSKLSSFRKKLGIGVSKEEWKKGEPERKAKRKAKSDTAKATAASKREENRRKAKGIKTKKVAPQSFGKSFSSARKAGKKTFTWKGKSYSTKTADDVKKEKASKKAAPKPDIKKIVKNLADKKYEPTGDVATVQGPNPGPSPTREYYEGGGKVEGNPFGWPSKDSRKR